MLEEAVSRGNTAAMGGFTRQLTFDHLIKIKRSPEYWAMAAGAE